MVYNHTSCKNECHKRQNNVTLEKYVLLIDLYDNFNRKIRNVFICSYKELYYLCIGQIYVLKKKKNLKYRRRNT